jgi:hypothetical protein
MVVFSIFFLSLNAASSALYIISLLKGTIEPLRFTTVNEFFSGALPDFWAFETKKETGSSVINDLFVMKNSYYCVLSFGVF